MLLLAAFVICLNGYTSGLVGLNGATCENKTKFNVNHYAKNSMSLYFGILNDVCTLTEVLLKLTPFMLFSNHACI